VQRGGKLGATDKSKGLTHTIHHYLWRGTGAKGSTIDKSTDRKTTNKVGGKKSPGGDRRDEKGPTRAGVEGCANGGKM